MFKYFVYFFSTVVFIVACSTIKPELLSFESNSKSIVEGESVRISWNILNGENFQISIDGIGPNLKSSGSEDVTLTKSHTFILTVMNGDEMLIKKSITVDVTPKPQPIVKKPEVKPKPVVVEYKKYKPTKQRKQVKINNNCMDVSQGSDDGRFTIGVDVNGHAKRLMYGFPIPHSTSHFIVNIDGKLASNSPYFAYYGENKICYISGDAMTLGDSKSISYSIKYKFRNVEIVQKLIPVDGLFNEVEPNQWGQYYRIEYTITNHDNSAVSVGLMLLIDTMIDDNDAAQMSDEKSDISKEKEYDKSNMPDNVYVYYDINNKKSLTGLLNLNKGKAVKPDKLYVGRWPYFHSIPWNVVVEPVEYFDSAILCLWDMKTIPSFDSLYMAVHYGSTVSSNKIRALLNTDFVEDILEFQYPIGSTRLSGEQKTKLKDFLSGRPILGAIVEGFSDAVGSSNINEIISKQRANDVKANMKKLGIPEKYIIIKYYGERYSDQSNKSVKYGNKYDRKVQIKLFIQQ